MKRPICVHRRVKNLANKGERGGAVLVAALVCLLIVMGMLAAMLKGTLREHRQLRRERDLRQTELLLEAGCDRARYRLANETAYRGETWKVPADAFANTGEGQVAIEITLNDGQTARKAHVVAEFPFGDETSIRRSRTFQVLTQMPLKQE